MYHQYFGLAEPPFSIAVNPRYLFMSAQHRDALAHLLYGVGSGGGFILLTGEVGTGKTTLNRCLLEQLPDNTDIAIVLNPALSAVELLATVCDELAIEYSEGTGSLKVLTDALHQFLLANYASDRRTVLMIDEAQHLNFDVLEQIRLLTNLETDERKLLQIILIGQPELTAILARPELRQLNQRITARFNLTALSADEVKVYVHHRLQIAGLKENRGLFSDAALRELYRLTDGIPRLINLICDRAMTGAYGRGQSTVSKSLVREAASEVLGAKSSANLTPSSSGRALAVMLIVGCIAIISVALHRLGADLGMLDRWHPPSSSSELEPPQVEVDPALDRGAEPPAVTPDQWQLDPARAEQALWQLRFDDPLSGGLCAAAASAGWRCETVESDVWDEVVAMKRPVLLDLRRSNGFAALTVLLRIEDDIALIWNGLSVCEIPLFLLTQSWLHRFRYLWLSPEGWSGPVFLGEQGPVVRQVVEAFAALDGLPAPPLDVFTAALERRVRGFQASSGLEVDGVIGAHTLQTLNDELGRGWWSPSAIDQFNTRIRDMPCR